jgi:hypothetical protein
MLWIDRVRLWRRRRWDRLDATLLGSRMHKVVATSESRSSFQIWEYMVEVPGPSGGAPVRLSFKEKTFKVRGFPEPGDVVPVVVNARRTKAMFDLADPRIDNEAYLDRRHDERRRRDEEEFERLRAGGAPAREPEEELP